MINFRYLLNKIVNIYSFKITNIYFLYLVIKCHVITAYIISFKGKKFNFSIFYGFAPLKFIYIDLGKCIPTLLRTKFSDLYLVIKYQFIIAYFTLFKGKEHSFSTLYGFAPVKLIYIDLGKFVPRMLRTKYCN